ncbi:AbrB/MazE/SpoVT family DNA-binding domain-containing protein [Salicibibacter halophilus]|uniref:AbrB/MazE/SpoVT family DNA-binding domain-containing protein n=1 Tax=Salicibibacter halophilus TaxID=2502791 RepID=A0A514LJ72_9BACI|nr:AbrB/MazE/SpoVT family DNA-binding domain-containing protein [Salicibibacter halophilus]QDI91575.1 AbrB/MazE/SpoVT family DNA-binding domain-containing protein [Salicibibacter halophilus]
MKSTGIVRKVDELGRVVIPMELRKSMEIANRDAMEIYVNEDQIILKKYKPSKTCQVTGDVSNDNLSLADGNIVLSPEGAEQIIEQLQEYVEGSKSTAS